MASMTSTQLSRRSFLATMATLPLAFKSAASSSGAIPVGLELYSVRDALKKDPEGTIRAVAAMGYQAVEFYAPYFEWTEAQAKQTRKLMDELGIRCYSTHNDQDYLNAKNIPRTRDLNLILGSKYVVLAHWEPKTKNDPEGWRELADELNTAAEHLAPASLKVGYHNHQAEFTASGGQRPMEVIARNTKPSVMLQLDVGTCLEAGADPVAWIRANPGRIRSIHCKEWSPAPEKGYKVLLGEGVADWKGIFEAAENVGGVEYYLVEQEGSRFPELETASRCLQAFRARHTGR
jgi:sugar phosphate isomerase/epimerase